MGLEGGWGGVCEDDCQALEEGSGQRDPGIDHPLSFVRSQSGPTRSLTISRSQCFRARQYLINQQDANLLLFPKLQPLLLQTRRLHPPQKQRQTGEANLLLLLTQRLPAQHLRVTLRLQVKITRTLLLQFLGQGVLVKIRGEIISMADEQVSMPHHPPGLEVG